MKNKFNYIWLLIALCLYTGQSSAQDFKPVLKLSGMWKFSIGDEREWAKSNYNDRNWEEIRVPSSWEDQGFHGYDGYAWYRKHFSLNMDLKGKSLYAQLGNIDDVDMVYVNGNLIGFSGSFPPHYQTAYNVYRRYPIPERFINKKGDNVIAVRVYDAQLSGGITNGDIGLFVVENSGIVDFNLEGLWKFSTGDDMNKKEKNYDDRSWRSIMVPGYWETQGYPNYDGFAWYRKSIVISSKLKGKRMILVMGKIDDLDQVYLNGKLIGSTGEFRNNRPVMNQYSWEQIRIYYIPDNCIEYDQQNIIAVRVYDGYLNGGIYQGPVGLMSQDKFNRIYNQLKQKHSSDNILDILFGR